MFCQISVGLGETDVLAVLSPGIPTPAPLGENIDRYITGTCSPLQAYKIGLYGSNHIWILTGPSLSGDWIYKSASKLEDMGCTRGDGWLFFPEL